MGLPPEKAWVEYQGQESWRPRKRPEKGIADGNRKSRQLTERAGGPDWGWLMTKDGNGREREDYSTPAEAGKRSAEGGRRATGDGQGEKGSRK